MNKIISIILTLLLSVTMAAQTLTYNLDSIGKENVYFYLSGEADKAIGTCDYPSAIMYIQEALAVEPDNPTNPLLLSNLGILCNILNQDSLAMDAFDRALMIAPSMTIALNNRGKLHLKIGDEKRAFEDFGKVVERDSSNTEALFYHGIIALYSGQQEVARRDISRLQHIAPDSHNTLIALASFYSLTGANETAIPFFQKLIEEDPQPEYYAGLAGCYLSIDDLSDASALLKEAMERFRDDPELFMYRAWLNKKRYLNKASREDAKKAISLGADPNKVRLLLNK